MIRLIHYAYSGFLISKLVLVRLILTLTFTLHRKAHGQPYLFDTRFPWIYSYKSSEFTHFGATVSLSSASSLHYTDKPTGWLFIGAPTANLSNPEYQPGVVWKCSIGRGYELGKDIKERCTMVDIDPDPKSARGQTNRGPGSPSREDRDNMWTGGSLEVAHGRLLACAPRHMRGQKLYMNGICYFFTEKDQPSFMSEDGPQAPKNGYSHRLLPFFLPDDESKKIKTNDKEQIFTFNTTTGEESISEWKYGEVGMSIHIPDAKGNAQEVLLGAPGVRMWSGAVVRYKDNPSNSKAPNFRINRDPKSPIFSEYIVMNRGYQNQQPGKRTHWFDYFGYSISSGRYFNREKLLYAAGSPRGGSDLSGEVIIFDVLDTKDGKDPVYKQQIDQPILAINPPEESFGSYFGYALASLDIDDDGRDELFVGAPFFSIPETPRSKRDTGTGSSSEKLDRGTWSGDHGCVFLYSFSVVDGNRNWTYQKMLPDLTDGTGSRFGSAISNVKWKNEVNGIVETFIVIGAPYEDNGQGAIYIYNSSAILIQKISASHFPGNMKAFGSVISLPQDIDNNGSPDLAIGSYQSSSVVILRTRPKASLNGNVEFVDSSLSSKVKSTGKVSSTSEKFTIKSCFILTNELGITKDADIYVTLRFDKRLQVAKGFNKLTKLDDSLYIYKTKVLKGEKDGWLCLEDIPVNVSFKENFGKRQPYAVSQSLWFNATKMSGTEASQNGTIINTIKGPGIVQGSGKGFQEFLLYLPYPIARKTQTFVAEFAPNDCKTDTCRPDLQFESIWINQENETLSPGAEASLGEVEELIFKLTVTNRNETAIKPSFAIEWPANGVVINTLRGIESNILLRKDICREARLSEQVVYNCQLEEDITKRSPMIIEIPFSFREAYNLKEAVEEFKIQFSVKPQDIDERKFGDLSLLLKTDAKLLLFGSRQTDTILRTQETEDQQGTEKMAYISSRQSYRLVVEGKSRIRSTVRFRFPYEVDKGSTQTPFIFVVIPNNNKYCTYDHAEHYYKGPQIHDSSVANTDFFKPEAEGIEEPFPFPKEPELISNSALLLTCHDEVEVSKIPCRHITCNVVVPGKGSVVLNFEVLIRGDKYLPERNGDGVLIMSYGNARTFDQDLTDTAQNLLKQALSPVSSWIYGLSALFGLLQLIILALILYKCGFFKRKGKEALALLKQQESTRTRKTSTMNRSDEAEQSLCNQETEQGTEEPVEKL